MAEETNTNPSPFQNVVFPNLPAPLLAPDNMHFYDFQVVNDVVPIFEATTSDWIYKVTNYQAFPFLPARKMGLTNRFQLGLRYNVSEGKVFISHLS